MLMPIFGTYSMVIFFFKTPAYMGSPTPPHRALESDEAPPHRPPLIRPQLVVHPTSKFDIEKTFAREK